MMSESWILIHMNYKLTPYCKLYYTNFFTKLGKLGKLNKNYTIKTMKLAIVIVCVKYGTH